jgi:GNAT superfamily N-acetyltransferase
VPEPRVRVVSLEQARPLRHAVLRPHETLEQLAVHEPPDCLALAALDGDGTPLAVGLVAPDGEAGDWRIRGMATAPAVRGRGLGSAVLAELVRHAVDQGAVRVWCNARTPARSFYERGGFHVVSDEFDLPGIGPHVRMERGAAGTGLTARPRPPRGAGGRP